MTDQDQMRKPPRMTKAQVDTLAAYLFLAQHWVEYSERMSPVGEDILRHTRIWLVKQLPISFIDEVLESVEKGSK